VAHSDTAASLPPAVGAWRITDAADRLRRGDLMIVQVGEHAS